MDDETRRRKRENAIRKIRALRQKTVENGATEAEAMSAAAIAAQMMVEYDIDAAELEADARETGVHQTKMDPDPIDNHFFRVCEAIAELCDVITWRNVDQADRNIGRTFFGLPHDVEVAVYLAEICRRAMKDEVKRHAAEWMLFRPARREKAKESFLHGMSKRLSARITELAWARRQRATSSALVPLKDQIINKALKDEGISLSSCPQRGRDVDANAYMMGESAANRISLNAALGEQEQAPKLPN